MEDHFGAVKLRGFDHDNGKFLISQGIISHIRTFAGGYIIAIKIH
jgi:hypothetical protein